MNRDELPELHYIAPIANVATICRLGILSHRQAKKVKHVSVAMKEIQERRKKVVVPGGRLLHDYANLYICARNPMLFRLKNQHVDLCVLRLSPNILDLEDVVVSDGNASSQYTRFAPAPRGLAIVDRDLVFSDFWTHPGDPIREWKHKSVKCAEVLVPDRVNPEFIIGAYVSCQSSETALHAILHEVGNPLNVIVNGRLFFR